MISKINDEESPELNLDLSEYPKLSKEQLGHLRHFYNLAFQEDGSWNHMGAIEPMQEFFDAYRYQIATMSYAVAVTHFHRTPALRSVYKPLFRRLIHKMLRREVWGYWFLASHSGKFTDPDRTELRKPWADPVVRENIMYSGHLLLMTSLYAMLFDDDEFEKPDSLVFEWHPLFWAMGPETYSYDNRSLQEAILAEMERNNWVGVCCEPNTVFVVCNQFPIIAMRYNDVRHGTQVVDQVLQKYRAAWDKKGILSPDGLFVDWLFLKQESVFPPAGLPYGVLPPRQITFTAWAVAFMNSWNSDFVKSKFDQQSLGYISKINGEYRLRPMAVASAIRNLVREKSLPSDSQDTLEKAIEESANLPPSPLPYITPTYGIVTQWLSELGKGEELEGLLQYADEQLHPTWENGGLFYPRNDEQNASNGSWTHMDPLSGNAAIGYGRLNIPDGQKIMWDSPWTKSILANRPWIDGIDMSIADCSRGIWDEEKKMLVLTVQTYNGDKLLLKPCGKNLESGTWNLYVNEKLKESKEIGKNGEFSSEIEIGGEEANVAFIKV